jgi:NADPH:quinone reductase-like Zn-dependent oxidoreductase
VTKSNKTQGPGHEVAGIIDELGPDITGWKDTELTYASNYGPPVGKQFQNIKLR